MSDGFARVPRFVTDQLPSLGLTAFAVYVVLADHCDGDRYCGPSLRVLCERCGTTSRRTIIVALKKLLDTGCIRRLDSGGRYSFHLPMHPTRSNGSIAVPTASGESERYHKDTGHSDRHDQTVPQGYQTASGESERYHTDTSHSSRPDQTVSQGYQNTSGESERYPNATGIPMLPVSQRYRNRYPSDTATGILAIPPSEQEPITRTTEQEPKKENQEEKETARPRRRPQRPAADEIDAMFDRFWASYPKKVDKQRAFASFKRLKPTEELLTTVLGHLSEMCHSPDWTRDGGRYIPNPTTYLNNRRWEASLDIGLLAGTNGHEPNGRALLAARYATDDDYQRAQGYITPQRNDGYADHC